ncbi:uncharacterized protein LOC135244758 [Anguilla rostrata]|uniref:uncharacterized protein LOC135244758 n=1 Tax=Anguilla rostrata TaxID=7938 RepID=UPI0030D4F2F6
MGLVPSSEEKEEFRKAVGAHIYEAMLQSGSLPDVGIERHLLDSPGLRPGPAARDCFRELRKHVDVRGPAYLKELMGKLAAFTEEPRLTGLLTLLVSMAIETAYASRRGGPPQGAVPEERLAQLRDLTEEYLKRHGMHLDDERKLREDTERLEGQVSLLLTQIKNAALAGGLVNSRTLKHWVNGAAFHVQMLIHLARLGQQSDGPARAAIAAYREDLRELLLAYRKYKSATVRVCKRSELRLAEEDGGPEHSLAGYSVHDREVGGATDVSLPEDTPPACQHLDVAFCAEAYLDHLFANYPQITDAEAYFSHTLSSLPALIPQTGLLQSPASNALKP